VKKCAILVKKMFTLFWAQTHTLQASNDSK